MADRQPFTPRGPFVVARPFKFNGRSYSEGDSFDVIRSAADHRRVRQLWDLRKIEVEGDYVPVDEEPPSDETLLGSDTMPDEVQVGEEKMPLGDIVQLAFDKSDLTAEEWNELSNEDRDAQLQAVVDELSGEPTAGEGEFLFDPEIHQIDHEGTERWIATTDELLLRVYAPVGNKLEKVGEKTLVTADEIIEWAEEE